MVKSMPRIINPEDDADYVTEVRILLGVTNNELSDAALKMDIIIGAAERDIIRHVDNWISIVDGDDSMKSAALRSSVIIRAALNIISTPAIQNLLIDQTRLIDVIITAKKATLEEVRGNLSALLDQQLASAGIVHTGGYPEHIAIGKTDNLQVYTYQVTETGDVTE